MFVGDRHGQWQALEGLGAVSFLNNQIDKAARYFQQALGVLAATEQNHEAQDRIVGKLKDVLRFLKFKFHSQIIH